MALDVHQVAAVATYPLRQQVLRSHQAIAEVAFPGDEDTDTGHFAACECDGAIIGVVTIVHQAPSFATGEEDWWRLRGMATADQARNRGAGRALVDAAVAHAVARGGTRLWCNARVRAAGFYRSSGFRAVGDEWEEPIIGRHVAMWRAVVKPTSG